MKVFKRSGAERDFDPDKITAAVTKANNAVDASEQMSNKQLAAVIKTIEKNLEGVNSIKVEDIQDIVEQALMKHNQYAVAKAYIIYRNDKKKLKKFTEAEEQILSVIGGSNTEMRSENANKHLDVNSTVRDYIAGVCCRALAEKILPKHVMEAHKKKWIHFHDMDYSPVQHLHNCSIVNVENMLQNGFQMGDVHIDKPKKFSTACNLMAQINLQVSSTQYGGQTVSWAHLLPFIDGTRKAANAFIDEFVDNLPKLLKIAVKPIVGILKKALVERITWYDVYTGVKTYQYQTLSGYTANGQTPFVSNVLNLREAESQEELDDFAMVIEEILKRRLKGVKDKSGKFVGPLFPKLLYYTCEGLNLEEKDPYYYLTKLAAKCIALRMQPDIMSEKKTREVKAGQIISPMGCRSFLAPVWEEIRYPMDTKFHWQYIEEGNQQYNNAPGKNFDYSRGFGSYGKLPVEHKDRVVINFAGNSGWIKEIDEDRKEIIVLKPKVYGRFNCGIVSLNLPHAALTAKKLAEKEKADLKTTFYKVLDQRLALCHDGLMERWKSIQQIKAKNSPILWMHGAITRMQPEASVADYIMSRPDPATTSISLGYLGLYETCKVITGQSNTTDEGRQFCKGVLTYLNDTLACWKNNDHLGFAIYGVPAEALTYSAALALQRDFGYIEGVTDKDYVVNSYHVDPREKIDAFKKLEIEGEYLALSAGGAVSYVETADLTDNPEAIETLIRFMHDHIMYAEVNRKIGICYHCGYQGDVPLTKTANGDFEFTCPDCGEKKDLSVDARLCGYVGTITNENVNKGRLDDIYHRTLHLN